MERSGEVDYLEHKCLSAVVALVSKGGRYSDPPQRDGLLAQNHPTERVRATLELVMTEPQLLKVVKVSQVIPTNGSTFSFPSLTPIN
jgi:hypothetical protein